MKNKRKRFTNSFKARVAIEAITGLKTIAQIASDHKIHVSQVNDWKKHLQENADSLFERKGAKKGPTAEELTAPMLQEIGRLQMEVNWLGKKL